jgi:hypothetical protein
MPPSNAQYYVAAYVAAAVIYLAYGISLAARVRRLRARLDAVTTRADQRP